MSRQRADERCDYEHLAAGAALYALEPEEDDAFSEHLPRCERCQDVLRSSKEAASYLGVGVPQEDPPPELRERILSQAAQTPQVTGDDLPADDLPPARAEEFAPAARRAEVRRIPARRKISARVLVAAAAVVAIAVTGVLGARVLELSEQQRQTVAQSEQMSRALAAVSDDGASMAVLRSPEGQQVATLVSGKHDAAVVPAELRPSDASHIYVVWGMDGQKPVPVSTFSVRSGAPQIARALPWSAGAAEHDVYAISLEPGQKAPAAPTNVVAKGAKAT